MNDIINHDELEQNIVNELLTGKQPKEVSEYLDCDLNMVNRVFGSDIFATLCREKIENRLNSAALRAVTNLSHIADDASLACNPRIRANEILLSKALEIQTMQGVEKSAADMSQSQLIQRLNDLQNEANARAKPIDTGVIEHEIDLDDMLS